MDGSIICPRFFDFFAEPKKASPHRCGLPWAVLCGCGQPGALSRPSRSVHLDGTARPAPASYLLFSMGPWLFTRPPQREKGRTHMRIDCSSLPPATPRHLCLHTFCKQGLRFLCAPFHRMRCASIFFFNSRLQKLRKQRRCQKAPPPSPSFEQRSRGSVCR